MEAYVKIIDTIMALYKTPEAAFILISLAVVYNLFVDIRMDRKKDINNK